MKTKFILVIIVIVTMVGCGGNKQSVDDLIIVDVATEYPEKELILQDFMDVEYIPLETTEDFITQGYVRDIGKDIIVAGNYISDGDIFIFDRSGKTLRKINRKGQGGEEYTQSTDIILDEDNNELFVVDYPARKIIVYDLCGNFKRSFKFADIGYYTYTFNYDKDHLICYKSYISADSEQACHLIISKQNGSVVREIQVPAKGIKTPVLIIGEATLETTYHQTLPYQDSWVLINASSDTMYRYSPDGYIYPLIARTPSIYHMDTEVYLFPVVFTDRYYFMRTIKKEFDLETRKGFPSKDLVYDRQEKETFEYILYNGDFSNKRQMFLRTIPVNAEIAFWQRLDAPNLVEAYEKGELKGRLNEIAANLDEEDNAVIVLAKYKK